MRSVIRSEVLVSAAGILLESFHVFIIVAHRALSCKIVGEDESSVASEMCVERTAVHCGRQDLGWWLDRKSNQKIRSV